jgi:hypothetical protein
MLNTEFLKYIKPVQVFQGCDRGYAHVYQLTFQHTLHRSVCRVMVDSVAPIRKLGHMHLYLMTHFDTSPWYSLFSQSGYELKAMEEFKVIAGEAE